MEKEDVRRLLLMRMEIRRYRQHLVAVRDRIDFLLTGKEIPPKIPVTLYDEANLVVGQNENSLANAASNLEQTPLGKPLFSRALPSEEALLMKVKKKKLDLKDNKSESPNTQIGKGEENTFSPSACTISNEVTLERAAHSYTSMKDAFSFAKRKLSGLQKSPVVNESQLESQSLELSKLLTLEEGMPWSKKCMFFLRLYTKVPFSKFSLKQIPSKVQLFIHPQSHFRAQWNLLVAIFMSLWVIICPAITAFQEEHEFLVYFLFTTVIFQLMDILMNCLTSIKTDEGVEESPQVVVLDYLRSYFILEFLCLLPYAAAFVLSTGASSQTPLDPVLLLFLNVGMLAKLLESRLSQKYNTSYDFNLLLRHFGVSVNPNLVRVATVFWFMAMYCHFFACLFYIVGAIEGYPPDSWISKGKYLEYNIPYRYTHSVFMVISLILCNGYGQQTVRNNMSIDTNLETWMAIICNFVGAMINAALIASISALISSFDISGQLYKEKMDELNEYLQYIRLDRPARRIIKEYFTLKFNGGKYFKHETIMKELNVSLQTAVAKHTCESLVLKVPFFRECGQHFINCLLPHLKMTHILPGQYVVEQGSFGDEMYFIQSGKLEVLIQGTAIKVVQSGAYFGEVAVLLGHTKRSASIRARTFSILFVLQKKSLDPILKNYPEMRQRFLIIAEKRLEELAAANKATLPPGSSF